MWFSEGRGEEQVGKGGTRKFLGVTNMSINLIIVISHVHTCAKTYQVVHFTAILQTNSKLLYVKIPQ